MMEKVFDVHVHTTMFERPIYETAEIYKKEMEMTGTEKIIFLSAPHHANDGVHLTYDYMQNIRCLFCKHLLGKNGYAFAGLVHPMTEVDLETRSNSYLEQAKEFHKAGFDGIKMLEGAPTLRKVMKLPLSHWVYDKFYGYLEEHGIPIIMHLAHPADFWDMSKVDDYARSRGWGCDETYPKKEEFHKEVNEIMKKFPKLRLTLAHMGFLSDDMEEAERWLSYENTMFDLTPGGEQLLAMGKDWKTWHKFFIKYQDRIMYGTDLRAFPCEPKEKWIEDVQRRPAFIRQFFETDTEHVYIKDTFCGIKIEKDIREKIYYKNAEREFGEPKPIDFDYMKAQAKLLLQETQKADDYADSDLEYILDNLK